ncbi:hypothetical protein F2Q69_00048837 [Brassica cretica]|uniref:Uncharacterized protein n=1 Tax=Brassica cretica TaxID=69181 RepID=A0A8S9PYH0_BRACR|nr:hypothetical protein F2Q69_00048837 [Brassica cretica]
MTHSFLERIGQPEVDLANDREEIVPFNVIDATFILEFSLSQMFSMLFRESLGLTETERNALMLQDFSRRSDCDLDVEDLGYVGFKNIARNESVLRRRLGIARDDQEAPGMIRNTCQVMRFWRQIEAREEGW